MQKFLIASFLFFSFELVVASSQNAHATSIQGNNLQAELCHLKQHVNQNLFKHKGSYFFPTQHAVYKGYSDKLIFLTRKPLIGKGKGYFQLVGIKADILPLKTNKTLVEWYEYYAPNEGNNLSGLCKPDLNKGKCLFKVVYVGQDMKAGYDKRANSHVILRAPKIGARIYSNNKLLTFPDKCDFKAKNQVIRVRD